MNRSLLHLPGKYYSPVNSYIPLIYLIVRVVLLVIPLFIFNTPNSKVRLFLVCSRRRVLPPPGPPPGTSRRLRARSLSFNSVPAFTGAPSPNPQRSQLKSADGLWGRSNTARLEPLNTISAVFNW